jgi:hypothetical protein
MKTTQTMIRTALVALMLFSGITNSAQAFLGGGGVSIGAGGPTVMRIKGKVFCAGCKLDQVRKEQPQEPRLYQLTYNQGQVVMKVEWVSNPGRWNRVVWPAKVWLRGAEAQLLKLAAEENQQKEIEITGILSNSRTFDITEVMING